MASSTISALVRAARPLAHANIAPPILFGQALAIAQTGRFSWRALAVAQIFGVIDHLVIVFANDYADREADARNASPTPFSGGSRVLQRGELAPSTVRNLAIASALALVGLSVWAASYSPLMPSLALAALVLIAAYSYPPLRLSYRGGGEILQGLGVGVVLPMVGIAAQGGFFDTGTLLRLLPTFVLGVAGNVLTSIPDAKADAAADKRSPAARLGADRARVASILLHCGAMLLGAVLLPAPAGYVGAAAGIALQLVAWRLPKERLIPFLVASGASESAALFAWAGLLVA